MTTRVARDRRRALALAVALGVGAATMAAAPVQAPEVVGADIRTVAAGDDLAPPVAEVVATGVDWIGWRVPLLPGQRACCGDHGGCCGTCSLGGDRERDRRRADDPSPGLTGDRPGLVILEAKGSRIRGVRAYDGGCRLTAGGGEIAWLGGVGAAASVAWLESVARGDASSVVGQGLGEEAVGVLALHDGNEAERALGTLARDAGVEVRESAIFWLGAVRGRSGYPVLEEIVDADPSARIRKRAVFALHLSGDPRATDRLIEVAHDDPGPEVRGQAIFWLARQAGEVAAGVIEDAVEHDPERDVRLQAVFGLSQLPADEGVPLLIRVARGHGDPEVRKRALFWLGQIRDDRALAFIEEVLGGGAAP